MVWSVRSSKRPTAPVMPSRLRVEVVIPADSLQLMVASTGKQPCKLAEITATTAPFVHHASKLAFTGHLLILGPPYCAFGCRYQWSTVRWVACLHAMAGTDGEQMSARAIQHYPFLNAL